MGTGEPSDPAGQSQALEALDPAALLERIAVAVENGTRYLGGIYGLLQAQEGVAGAIGDLAPMVLAMLGQGPGQHGAGVIEGGPVG